MPSPNTSTRDDLDTPNENRVHEVSRDILPVHCPLSGSSLWNSHPRVYIPLEENGSARCPYCGTEYILKD